MMAKEQMRELSRQLTEIREHLHALSLHVVQMFSKRLVNRCPGWSWSVVGRFDLSKPMLGRSMASSCGEAVH